MAATVDVLSLYIENQKNVWFNNWIPLASESLYILWAFYYVCSIAAWLPYIYWGRVGCLILLVSVLVRSEIYARFILHNVLTTWRSQFIIHTQSFFYRLYLVLVSCLECKYSYLYSKCLLNNFTVSIDLANQSPDVTCLFVNLSVFRVFLCIILKFLIEGSAN